MNTNIWPRTKLFDLEQDLTQISELRSIYFVKKLKWFNKSVINFKVSSNKCVNTNI